MPTFTPTDTTRSEEVQEIVGRPPSWIVRVGTMVIACLTMISMVGAWFVRYPDLVDAPVTFASASPPIQIAAHNSGRIQTLYVHDSDITAANQVVAVLENAASTSDVFRLAKVVQNMDTTLNLALVISHIGIPTSLQAGDLQADYANLYQAISAYKSFVANRSHTAQLASLRTQITYYQYLNAELATKRKSLNEQLELERQKDSINRELLGQKVIAKLDFNDKHKLYLSQQLTSSDNNASIIQNQLQQSEYQKTLAVLQNEHEAQLQDLLNKVRGAVKVLVGRIATWDQKYVLRTPISGRINFFKVWTPNQYVKTDEPVFVVVPSLHNQFARASLPVFKAGKVRVGQTAHIRLNEYPFEEFGQLRGTIEKVSEVSLDGNYLITIRLTSLRTSTGFQLPLRTELSGTAQIVTEDRNVIQRIFSILLGRLAR
ncbi:HlyD family secretion protein [Hymenobacter sp. DH14]|uniref:HlyD family secretion protein n=1 Tax=Hymenobacter cyanobacteriorum TaxID=2926463 RepID=A0A9X1VIP2_9BACT|nr:HlyD family efflux transporter periplasmic adaptor subunit [Hymenobacter cyanobacteriorum]MCI1189899.1 HlyD family secretion protein [Hymenobacter cyanobacteriorum]